MWMVTRGQCFMNETLAINRRRLPLNRQPRGLSFRAILSGRVPLSKDRAGFYRCRCCQGSFYRLPPPPPSGAEVLEAPKAPIFGLN